jgi:SAM-dependent methyltransferase
MPTIEQNRTKWSVHDWSSAGAEWSWAWGSVEQEWAHTFYSRIVAFLPARSILEIATGYGRWTGFLIKECNRFYGLDVTENCVHACRDRYGLDGQFFLTDGKTIPAEIEDNSIDFVFSADSLVHADAEVIRSYLQGLLRVMSPEGVAFLHHSNFADTPEGTRNLHWRDAGMSAARLRAQCQEIGLFCLSQELINWGQSELNDCFSLIGKAALWEPRIVRNQNFSTEIAHARSLACLYHPRPISAQT